MSRKNWSHDKLFERLLTNRSQATYWENIFELRTRPCQAVFSQAFQLAQSNDEKSQRIGIDILAQLGQSPRFHQTESIALFFQCLSKATSIKIIETLLYAIGHNNDNLTEKQILQLCDTPLKSSRIRYALTFSLLGISHPLAIAMLIKLSKDKVVAVRDWATFGLGTQIETNTPEIIEALWQRCRDSDSNVQAEAIAGLAQRGDRRIIPIISQLLKGGEFVILIFEAILILGDKQFLSLLEDIKQEVANQSVNAEWKSALLDCIAQLQQEKDHVFQE